MKKGMICLGLGTNLGDLEENLRMALHFLEPSVQIIKSSNLYESEPFGKKDQPWFLNMCVLAETALTPQELLEFCKKIESDMGREKGEKWGPRLIDIDILLYDDRIIEEEVLTIPHKQLHKRKFVLLPLSEIAGDILHPQLKKPLNELLNSCEDVSIVRLH
ncbi:2-amino-4-hydroxy-6-hydroxymethyldihydropteridine diphosphokinase [Patescibacteria group bacterium]|nr:2-amino-4-hydroxy-6-hydroxymethyldihydropteridine diphosphokinase [Patescibacteria group bacterium]